MSERGTNTLLYLDGVTVSFDGFRALNALSLVLEPGEMRAVIGPNGAGKTTLLNLMSGFQRAHAGSVRIGKQEITGFAAPDVARAGLARTFQHPELFTGLSVREHLMLGDRLRHAPSRIARDVLSTHGLRRPDAAETSRVAGLLDLLGLAELADQEVGSLPLGGSRSVPETA